VTLVVAMLSGGLTFAAALIVLTTQRRALVRQRLTPYVGTDARPRARTISMPSVRTEGAVKRLLERWGLEAPVSRLIERAGVDLAADSLVLLVGAAAVGAFLLVLLASNAAIAVVGALVGGVVPFVLLEVKARRRTRAFERQLPEILDTLAASLRAGHSFDQAIQALAAEMSDPAGRELRRVVAATHLGRSVDESLAEIGNRIRSADLQFVLDAVTVQRQVGGSLAGLFELVAHTVRAREEFRLKVKALTSLPRTTARVLTVLPFVAAFGLTLLNKSYMSPLWHTSLGHVMTAVGLAMMTCGGILLRRIGSVAA
jgi:tight adherence protein B